MTNERAPMLPDDELHYEVRRDGLLLRHTKTKMFVSFSGRSFSPKKLQAMRMMVELGVHQWAAEEAGYADMSIELNLTVIEA